mgnify:CR=1 FL=1
MNISFLFFVFGLIMFIVGYTIKANPVCDEKHEIRYVPRDVYDNLVVSNLL